MRQSIHAATNEVESFHFFHDWITITTGDPVEQLKRNQYIDVVANAIMLHNVADLTSCINQLVFEKHPVDPEFIKHLSPYMTAHIKRFGQYVLNLEEMPEPLQFNKLDLK
jgi:hypothetical protein